MVWWWESSIRVMPVCLSLARSPYRFNVGLCGYLPALGNLVCSVHFDAFANSM